MADTQRTLRHAGHPGPRWRTSSVLPLLLGLGAFLSLPASLSLDARHAHAAGALGDAWPGAGALDEARSSAGAVGDARPTATVVADTRRDSVQAPEDSLEARERAERAQRRFERTRRRHLPATSPHSGPFDERIGRFHFWHGDGREPPAERAAVTAAREELLAVLDSVAARYPGDGWVAGQRVRYLVEAGDGKAAIAAARACRDPRAWWCHALLGHALHQSGDPSNAEAAFEDALAGMPEEERCRWTDLSLLLEGDGSDAYRESSCAGREPVEAAFWTLADPLWVVPGNDRRTEHLSRHVMDRMQEGADSGYGVRWGDDLRELLTRYGWPSGFWEVRRPFSPRSLRPDVVAYDPPGTLRFTPPAEHVFQGAAEDGWELDPRRPRSHHLPIHATSFVPLDGQVATFSREGGWAVVGTYDLAAAREPAPPCARVVAGLGALAAGPAVDSGPSGRTRVWRSAPVLEVDSAAGARGAFLLSLSAPAEVAEEERLMVGVEAFCPEERFAARTRRPVPAGLPLSAAGEPPRDSLRLSDLLLVETAEGEAPPSDLTSAVARARPRATARAGERLGLYWEVYGGVAGSSEGRLDVTVRLSREGGGFFRRALRWVGLAGESPETGLEWAERRPEARIAGRGVSLTLPDLSPGDYRLEVEVAAVGESAVTTRRLEVVR